MVAFKALVKFPQRRKHPSAAPTDPPVPDAPAVPASPDPALAVLVPVLDEEDHLEGLLPDLLDRRTGPDRVDRLIVSDGGSRDASRAVAERHGVEVVTGSTGRGPQLNRAAKAAGAAVDGFVFLHADTRLPPGALAAVRRALAGGAEGGGFHLRFDREGRLLALGQRLINRRCRRTGLPLGDQAQFVTRAAFEAVGGFPDWPILEDLELARRLRRRGRSVLLDETVTTSARRFERRGVVSTVLVNHLVWTLFRLGVSPRSLAGLYGTGR